MRLSTHSRQVESVFATWNRTLKPEIEKTIPHNRNKSFHVPDPINMRRLRLQLYGIRIILLCQPRNTRNRTFVVIYLWYKSISFNNFLCFKVNNLCLYLLLTVVLFLQWMSLVSILPVDYCRSPLFVTSKLINVTGTRTYVNTIR